MKLWRKFNEEDLFIYGYRRYENPNNNDFSRRCSSNMVVILPSVQDFLSNFLHFHPVSYNKNYSPGSRF